ncbi:MULTISPECIES: phosphodiester glycosidase family protein [unclassified Pseudocitrobacter]|uniref:phosphodiester glycosidase family protein n=1 Tax=unclassified Pseudocitrobacter TaxID=2638778 RepID=UPI0023E38AC7|nr:MULTISPECIES: phosphodiester glycosidase family protein [unclassified Pseudocitrobacter]MDF3826499.1 phosphodiester glycosidase family protein [Pseudocitrobacter sp. 2023EL-00150]MEC5372318.1 phosphodiester glycosidase family protein [Pseudocitrobacter sp. MW920760]
MMRLWLLSALLLPLTPFAHAACTLTDPSLQVQSYEVDLQQENITLRWKKPDGKAWGSLYSLLADINGNGQVLMAMNGGIYGKDYAPLGLYIEKGKKLAPINRASGGGNFFIRPGGVFYLKDQKAGIVTLDALKSTKGMDYAVQSGPMLIDNGTINWRLKPSASSRKLRNAVGINRQGRVVFMLSAKETNFYDFACYARSKLDIRQMLYLDGTISKMYQKGGSVPWQYHPFVTMITVERKTSS